MLWSEHIEEEVGQIPIILLRILGNGNCTKYHAPKIVIFLQGDVSHCTSRQH